MHQPVVISRLHAGGRAARQPASRAEPCSLALVSVSGQRKRQCTAGAEPGGLLGGQAEGGGEAGLQ